MLYEVNMSNPKAKSDAYLYNYWFLLSNQHCLKEEGVYILSGVTEKRQESEINTIAQARRQLNRIGGGAQT